MKTRYLSLAAFCLSAALSFAAQAQQSLADLVQEANAGWMFGKWKATTDEGTTLNFTVSWDLNEKVVAFIIKSDDMDAKGFTVLEPGAERPSYFGFDARGAITKGGWNYEDSGLVLRMETKVPSRGDMKWAAVFAGSASEGLQMRLHGLDASGNLVMPARTVLKFKKQ